MNYKKLSSIRNNPFFKVILTPVALLYKFVSFLRYYLYEKKIIKPKEPPYPVISIGNIIMGGSGKTSLTIELASELSSHSRIKPAILTRGYKGKSNLSVVEDQLNWQKYGDEPSLMKKKLGDIPILVSKNRIEGLQKALQVSNCNCFLLDDGFQYLKLRKNFEILLLDAKKPFGGYQFFPKGELRDGLWRIKDADVIIISNTQNVETDLRHLKKRINGFAPEVPIFEAHYKTREMATLKDDKRNLEEVSGKSAFLFAAIGNPDSLMRTVEGANINIADSHFFLDHHRYTEEDIRFLNTKIEKSSAEIFVTTEKDGIKLKNFRFKKPVYQLVPDFVVDKKEQLFNLIHNKLTEYDTNNL